jgi:hypothetical protein
MNLKTLEEINDTLFKILCLNGMSSEEDFLTVPQQVTCQEKDVICDPLFSSVRHVGRG